MTILLKRSNRRHARTQTRTRWLLRQWMYLFCFSSLRVLFAALRRGQLDTVHCRVPCPLLDSWDGLLRPREPRVLRISD